MMSMMARVMSKVDWPRKVFDEEICSKWKQEALSKDFSARMFDHVSIAVHPREGQHPTDVE